MADIDTRPFIEFIRPILAIAGLEETTTPPDPSSGEGYQKLYCPKFEKSGLAQAQISWTSSFYRVRLSVLGHARKHVKTFTTTYKFSTSDDFTKVRKSKGSSLRKRIVELNEIWVNSVGHLVAVEQAEKNRKAAEAKLLQDARTAQEEVRRRLLREAKDGIYRKSPVGTSWNGGSSNEAVTYTNLTVDGYKSYQSEFEQEMRFRVELNTEYFGESTNTAPTEDMFDVRAALSISNIPPEIIVAMRGHLRDEVLKYIKQQDKAVEVASEFEKWFGDK